MIRSPLGLRLETRPDRSLKEALREAAALGARGVVLDAMGDLAPDRLSETGRRDLRHTLRAAELTLIALNLPTRRPFDTPEQLDDRLARADRAFSMAYELGARLVLARVGGIPPESDPDRQATFTMALNELARRAEHRGVRLAIETGPDAGATLRGMLDTWNHPALAASIDPGELLRHGHDPIEATVTLGCWVAHAYANDASGGARRATVAHPRGFGFPPGALAWEEYLGALEEIDYRGFLTVWPDPNLPVGPQFTTFLERAKQL
jgi:sugar phosphate isomerase/epimerase